MATPIPPIVLSFPQYVVEYAVVGADVAYVDRRILNVGGEWLGAVPRLAICKVLGKQEFFLAHCSDDWDVLCLVENAATISEVKGEAEKHYPGIGRKWVETEYVETEAQKLYDEARREWLCSFCGRSHFDHDVHQLVSSESANICDTCIRELYAALDEPGEH